MRLGGQTQPPVEGCRGVSRSFERGKEAVCVLPASGRNLLSRHLSLRDVLAAKLQNRKRKKICVYWRQSVNEAM